jgi:uncharacterized protein YjbI with pentapeptide repeats/lysophospholipase L1-like esterase
MLRIQTKGMSQLKPMIIVLLMLTSALAGCTGTDTTDLEQQIADLQQSNDEMNETIYNMEITLQEKNSEIATLNSNVVMLQSSIADAETYRDSLLVLRENSNTSNDELESMIEAANNSILVLQSDLVVQQNLVVEWQQTAEDNRADLRGVDLSNANLTGADLTGAYLIGAYLSGADLSGANLTGAYLSGADLSGADLRDTELDGVNWYDTTCPDGTNSDNNGDTCENNIALYSDWLFIGDSDIEEWDTSQYIDSSNIGDGGSTCNDTLSSIDEVLEQYTPVHVVIVCGENDLWQRTVEDTFEDFQAIVNKIILSGASVTYMGTKAEPATTELHAEYREYDSLIQDSAVNLANNSYAPLNVVDVYQGFEDMGNPNSLYQDDELHLSLDGYEYWNQWLVQISNDSDCIIWQSQECRVSIE